MQFQQVIYIMSKGLIRNMDFFCQVEKNNSIHADIHVYMLQNFVYGTCFVYMLLLTTEFPFQRE